MEHYHEEERDLLPQLNAAGLGNKKQEELVVQSVAVMEASHAQLLPFLLQGLEPHDIHQYLGLLQCSFEGGKTKLFTRISFVLKNAGEEFQDVCKVAQERINALSAVSTAAGA